MALSDESKQYIIKKKFKNNIFFILLIIFFVAAIIFAYLLIEIYTEQKDIKTNSTSKVLGISDQKLEGFLIINLPTTFNQDITLKDKNINAGQGKIFASNLLYSVTGGQGIKITDGQNPNIINTDPGSSQNIFKSIKVGAQILNAKSNTDTLEFADTNGNISISNGKILFNTSPTQNVVNNITNNSISNYTLQNPLDNGSGFTVSGNSILLQNINNDVAIGTGTANSKLQIQSTGNEIGMVVEASSVQTKNLSEWRDSNGNPVVSFDQYGNATFAGNVIQSGFQLSGSSIKYTGQSSTMVLDMATAEPNNLLINPGLNVDLSNWSSDAPIAQNQALNPTMQDTIQNWTATTEGAGYPNQYVNPGFETDTSNWQFLTDNVTISEYVVPTANSNPQTIQKGPDGNIWFGESGANNLVRVTPSGTMTEFNIGGVVSYFTLGPDGNWWVGDDTNSFIDVVTMDGSIIKRIPNISGIDDIEIGSDNNIWVIDSVGYDIEKIDINGNVTDYGRPPVQVKYMAVNSDGNFYVTPNNTTGLVELTVNGTMTIVNSSYAANSSNIRKGPDGNLWASSVFRDKVYKIVNGGGTTTYNTNGGDNNITWGPDNTFWKNDSGSSKIYNYSLVSGIPVLKASYNVPNGNHTVGDIVVSSSGDLWFTDPSNNKVGALILSAPQNRVTSPTHNFTAGALNINAVANTSAVQTVTLTLGKIYNLSTYVYLGSSQTVDSNVAELVSGGSVIPTTYTYEGSGWYKLSATLTGSGASANYGVKIFAGHNAYVDDFNLSQFSGGFHVYSQYYSSTGSAEIDAPPASNVTFTQTTAFRAATYSIIFYAYKDGTAVTSSDIQLIYNGTSVPTTITSTAKSGWYQLTSSFVATNASTPWGVRVFSNRTMYVDDPSLLLGGINQVVSQQITGPIFESTGDVDINTIGYGNVNFYQSYTVTQQNNYVISAYIYNMTPGNVGGNISAANAVIAINGSALDTTFTAADNGWYHAQAVSSIPVGTYNIGITVKQNYEVRADFFAFQQGTGANRTLSIENSGSGLAFLSVESTTTLHSGDPSRQALIVQGIANQVANLTEWQDGNNNVLSAINKNGFLGIGTSSPSDGLVVIEQSTNSSPVAFVNSVVSDSSQNSVLRLGIGTPSGGTSSRFIQFFAGSNNESSGTGVGEIRLNNSGVAYETGNADFAEYFDTYPNSNFEDGDVLVIDNNGKAVTYKDNGKLLGVVTKSAAFIGNAKNSTNQILVGLVGQIDVKITNKNGVINKGDYVSLSSISGYSEKLTSSGLALGIALDHYDGKDLQSNDCNMFKCGRIKVYVQPRWVDIANVAKTDQSLIDANNAGLISINGGTTTIDKLKNDIQQSGDLIIKDGKIIYNTDYSGNVILPKGQTSIKISKAWKQIPNSITATADYNTYCWISDISSDGFILHVNNVSIKDQNINWLGII